MKFRIICFLAWSLLILSCSEKERKNDAPITSDVTWSKDIAPVIFKNCTPCHRPGESGPFNLLSYSDAIKKSKLIRFVTKTRYMPPWPADPAYTHFVGERVLSDNEISLITTWVDKGCKRGDSLNEP